MDFSAPAYNALSRPQKRAFLLRDSLRYLDVHHLEQFIEGIAKEEPPKYRMVNGTVQPQLDLVTLKDAATKFDLGNVQFDTKGDGTGPISRAFLTIENGHVELRTEDALPVDVRDLPSVPINIFIAQTMLPMFAAKFKAIQARADKINEIRRVAFNVVPPSDMEIQAGEVCNSQSPELQPDSEQEIHQSYIDISSQTNTLTKVQTLRKLDFEHSTQVSRPLQHDNSTKRKPGDRVKRHDSNRHKHTHLEAIFSAIPEKAKVELFNTVVKATFPNLSNLMMASWNVVSIHSHTGSDFPALHKAIEELESVLQEFEGNSGPTEEPAIGKNYQENFAMHQQGDMSGYGAAPLTPDADGVQNEVNALEGHVEEDQNMSQHGRSGHVVDDATANANEPSASMQPPRPSQQHVSTLKPDDDSKENQRHRSSSVRGKAPGPISRENASLGQSPLRKRKRIPSTDPATRTQDQPREIGEAARKREEHQASHLQNKPLGDSLRPSPHPSTTPLPTRAPTPAPVSAYLAPNNEPDAPPSEKLLAYADMSLTELRKKYNERRSQLFHTFGGKANIPTLYRDQMKKLAVEIRRRQEEGEEEDDDECEDAGGIASASASASKVDASQQQGDKDAEDAKDTHQDKGKGKAPAQDAPPNLGNSVLGEKKTDDSAPIAPVAPMVHVNNDDAMKWLRWDGWHR